MKWLRNRFLLLPYLALLVILVTVGCSSKEDPGETLDVTGNHSTGNLTMVTTDTSSDGYHYLNPQLSPDGNTILFSADWWAIPTVRDPEDNDYVINRQMITLPLQVGTEPKINLEVQGGVLIVLAEVNLPIGGSDVYLVDIANMDKGNPIWWDETHVIFWLDTEDVGARLFRADISDPTYCPTEVLFMEPTDADPSQFNWQHMEGTLSPNRRWLAFTRSGCFDNEDIETCTNLSIHVLDMTTAALDNGYGAVTMALTNEYSRVETPSWSPDGTKIIFSGGMDVGGNGTGTGTEIFSIDVDTLALENRNPVLDDNLTRLTFTTRAPGDPIGGILNYDPVYSLDSQTVYFVSTRRAPTTTLHDRNIWSIPADGFLEPEIYYFTRSDDMDPYVMPDGSLLLSSALGFPSEMLTRLEEEAYQTIVDLNNTSVEDGGYGGALDEVQMRELASEEVRNLQFFEGVMVHIYTFIK